MTADDWNPVRVVTGTGSEPVTTQKGRAEFIDDDTAGCLTLDGLELRAGDNLKCRFDFSENHLIYVNVVSIEANQPRLQTHEFPSTHKANQVRAFVNSRGGEFTEVVVCEVLGVFLR